MEQNREPVVSVIIPTYNRINTLPASVESVLNQTYGSLEVIIVDDGSDDGTEEYVRGFTDSRVRYIKNIENEGPSAARNLGVSLAEGEYVAFQDSDDRWLPEKLEKQMRLLLDPENDFGMVYCEITRYHCDRERGVVPSRNISFDYKQGLIFKTLLLLPLISTQTIVAGRQDFINAGGFNEDLNTFEDYEFTLRFSQSHEIGFVGEPLVKAYDSADSVNMRYGDRFYTQAYIVREMITPLREYDLLWKKLSILQSEAEELNCHDIFIRELSGLADLFVTEQEKSYAAELLEKTEQSTTKINLSKRMAEQELADTKQQIVKMYLDVYGDKPVGKENIEQKLHQVKDNLAKLSELFQGPEELQNICERTAAVEDPETKTERLFLFTEIVKAIEAAEAFLVGQAYECSVCGEKVFRSGEKVCPFCKAEERERLIVAFLQELQPEGEEKLHMLHWMPSAFQESYALGRKDILFEKLSSRREAQDVLKSMGDETCDIIVCPLSWENISLVRETAEQLYRIMKPSGIGVAVLPISWLEGLFYGTIAGENWFGEAFYRRYGFDRQSALYIFTKEKPLTEM
ncbi:MAG: glycosyltransferase family 2 protein [Lachnospiraceae bacterium]|nr:glycosyltransferase family 2 protein [Lachnospiraceae bacterium]